MAAKREAENREYRQGLKRQRQQKILTGEEYNLREGPRKAFLRLGAELATTLSPLEEFNRLRAELVQGTNTGSQFFSDKGSRLEPAYASNDDDICIVSDSRVKDNVEVIDLDSDDDVDCLPDEKAAYVPCKDVEDQSSPQGFTSYSWCEVCVGYFSSRDHCNSISHIAQMRSYPEKLAYPNFCPDPSRILPRETSELNLLYSGNLGYDKKC